MGAGCNALLQPQVECPMDAYHTVPYTTETSRKQLVLFDIQNRTPGHYLAAINRILISLMLPVSTLAAVAGIREHVHAGVAAYVRTCRGACALAPDAM
jgi:hypothetical protein